MMRPHCRDFSLPKELAVIIRWFEIAGLLTACVLNLAEGSLGSSGQAGPSEVAAHIDGLSVVVQASDGTYEIQTGAGGRSVIHARVAAEIDHKWVKSTDYPKHQISQSILRMLSDAARTFESFRPDFRIFLISHLHCKSMTGKPSVSSRLKFKITPAIPQPYKVSEASRLSETQSSISMARRAPTEFCRTASVRTGRRCKFTI